MNNDERVERAVGFLDVPDHDCHLDSEDSCKFCDEYFSKFLSDEEAYRNALGTV